VHDSNFSEYPKKIKVGWFRSIVSEAMDACGSQGSHSFSQSACPPLLLRFHNNSLERREQAFTQVFRVTFGSETMLTSEIDMSVR